jgi:hypothetical protein
MDIDKIEKIKSLLSFDFTERQGVLSVTRDDIRDFVKTHGMPYKNRKAGELAYYYADGFWVVEYYEKGCSIGLERYSDIIEALDPIMDYALANYVRYNPWNQTDA